MPSYVIICIILMEGVWIHTINTARSLQWIGVKFGVRIVQLTVISLLSPSLTRHSASISQKTAKPSCLVWCFLLKLIAFALSHSEVSKNMSWIFVQIKLLLLLFSTKIIQIHIVWQIANFKFYIFKSFTLEFFRSKIFS